MANKFYKDGNIWVSQNGNDSRELIQPRGNYRLIITNNLISIVGINADIVPLLSSALITTIQKNDLGEYYSDIEEFKAATELFFGVDATSIVDENGDPINQINPLQIKTSISLSDIDWENSDFSGWLGDPKDIFRNINDGGIYNDSNDNPKSFILRFIRTQKARDFGIGANTGNFSNVKVDLLGSSDANRGVLDASEDPAKETSFVYSQESFIFNAIKVQFYTDDRVDVTNIFINCSNSNRKQDYIHKFGINPDVDSGSNESIWTLGDQYIFTTTPQPYYISSSSASDVVEIEGELILMNSEGRYQRHIYNVLLQGQSKVLIPTPNNWDVVASNRTYNNNGTTLLGDVYVYEDTVLTDGVPNDLSKVRSHISQGRNQTEQAVYTVPEYIEDRRKVIFAELYEWSATAIRNKTASAIVDLRVAPFGKVSRVQGTRGLGNQFISRQVFGENTPLIIQPASDVYLQVSESSINDVAVEGEFTIKLVLL